MTIKTRFLWGCLAGLTIVLVKIIGPDQAYLRSIFDNIMSVDMVFYVFISIVTILLGSISGLFSKEEEPVKLMLFCASVPGLLSTFTGEQRDALPEEVQTAQVQNLGRADGPRSSFSLPVVFVRSAHAQPATIDKHICVEENFGAKFSKSAQRYLFGSKLTERPHFEVVIASSKNFDKAVEIAKTIDMKWKPTVGCRRPGNQFFPVLIGQPSTQFKAAELMGQYEEAVEPQSAPYVSFYEYRTAVWSQ